MSRTAITNITNIKDYAGKVMVLEQLLKAIRNMCPTDKAVLVSNYTETLDVLQKVGRR
jgi:hypothetical protein